MADTLALSRPSAGDILESVLLKGDLSKLSPDERITYMYRVCESAGLNPLTRPLEYINLSGKLVLYAKKDATDQLRKIHGISVSDMTESERDGVLTVTVKVASADGRTDMDKGSVKTEGLKGDNLANAIMKAATKAKRRATLSICGLGLLDETEIETIPNAVVIGNGDSEPAGGVPQSPHTPPRQQVLNEATGRMVDPSSAHQKRKEGQWPAFQAKIRAFTDLDELERWWAGDSRPYYNSCNAEWQRQADELYEAQQEKLYQELARK